MITKKELFIAFLAGAFGYALIEIVWRGFTHWSMALTGGICFMIFYKIVLLNNFSIFQQCLLATLIITSFEFTVGGFINLVWGMNVWDYSNQLFNLKGQICPLFSMAWFFMGIPMSLLTRIIRSKVTQLSI